MPHKLRKTRKKRSTRTVGWGRVGQHRKTGQRGHRKSGRRKHLWTYVLRYEPDYFLKKGFHSIKHEKSKVLNVGELEQLAARSSDKNSLVQKNGMRYLDLDKMGFHKLLGLGSLTKAFSIKISSYSESAAKKIINAGGNIVKEEPD